MNFDWTTLSHIELWLAWVIFCTRQWFQNSSRSFRSAVKYCLILGDARSAQSRSNLSGTVEISVGRMPSSGGPEEVHEIGSGVHGDGGLESITTTFDLSSRAASQAVDCQMR